MREAKEDTQPEKGKREGQREGGGGWAEPAVRRGFRGAGLSVRSRVCAFIQGRVLWGGHGPFGREEKYELSPQKNMHRGKFCI